MKTFRADLHIHTVLSPCGDLEMSPKNILKMSKEKQLDIIGITDHNHTGHALLVSQMAEGTGVTVLPGMEINTREEVHCLTYFGSPESLQAFQKWTDTWITRIPNDTHIFGPQVIIDREENILEEIPYYLGASVDRSIGEVEQKVHELDGLFIPAHIDRSKNSIYSQLGVMPDNLTYDALEISWRTKPATFLSSHPELKNASVITSSDAHFTENIGRVYTCFTMKDTSFSEIKKALENYEGRSVSVS